MWTALLVCEGRFRKFESCAKLSLEALLMIAHGGVWRGKVTCVSSVRRPLHSSSYLWTW